MVLPFAGGLAETDHVLGHELVHAFQYDIGRRTDGEGQPATGPPCGALPLWFIEGMAEYLSLGPVDPHTAMWIREASSREKLPTIGELDNPGLLPVPLRTCVLGLRGGAVGRRAWSATCCAPPDPSGDIEARHRRPCWASTRRRSGATGTPRPTRTYAPVIETTQQAAGLRPGR